MPVFEEFTFPSSTGKNTIRCLKCVPDGTPRGVVQIEHGIAEHMDRYRDFMSFLAENGFVAVGDDHLGHGKTIEAPSDQGFFAEENGWDYVIADIDKLHFGRCRHRISPHSASFSKPPRERTSRSADSST